MNTFIRTDDTATRIVSFQFIRAVDDAPDLSHLGEYTNSGGSRDAIKRENAGRGEYKYFLPAMTGEETGNPDSPRLDYERMEAYNTGDWHMRFCQAVAVVSIKGVMQRITSGGLSGVESDSGEDYFAEIASDEFDDLADILTALGFTPEQIDAARADVEAD